MRAIEAGSVALFLGLLAAAVLNFSAPAWFLPFAFLAGWILADLFSGLVHWGLDTFGSIRTPLIGPALIRPFREHHADPAAMTRHDFIEVNGASCLGCLPVAAIAGFAQIDEYLQATLLCFSAGILLTNQCHKWAHEERPNSLVRLLQASGLILRAAEHCKHHTPPYNSHFCTASGWLNRLLDPLLVRAR